MTKGKFDNLFQLEVRVPLLLSEIICGEEDVAEIH